MCSTMAGKPFKVGRFAHTLRVRLMREHLGVDVDAMYEEDLMASEIEINKYNAFMILRWSLNEDCAPNVEFVLDQSRLESLTLQELNEQLAKYRLLERDSPEKHIPMEKNLSKRKEARLRLVKEAADRYMRSEWEEL